MYEKDNKKFGKMITDQYPLIKKYAVSNENLLDFFEHFSSEQLEDFEHSLHLYYETDMLILDEDESLISMDGTYFNIGIIELATGMMSYDDFIKYYSFENITNEERIEQTVISYFKDNAIKDLMDYGNDTDEGLFHLSSLYKEILEKLNINFENVYTEDGISPGKYLTVISFNDNSNIELDTSAWNGIKTIKENIQSVCEFYNEIQKNKTDNHEEFDYDYE